MELAVDDCTDACCVPLAAAALSDAERERLSHRVRLLVATTISYNVVEAVIAISAGAIAGSTALIGFGLDSVIEVSSAAVVAWQFAGTDPTARERTALRVIAWSFFALAAYVSFDALHSLATGETPGPSPVGIALAAMVW